MTANHSSKQDAQRILDELKNYIAKAREILAGGDYVELHGLDEQVKHLCDAVANMKIEDSIHMQAELETMMTSLNDLQEAFVQSKQELEKGLHEVTKHRQASMAYKQSESTTHRDGIEDSAEPKE